VLWPRVGERVAAWRAEVGDDRVAVVEVPLLFEAGMENVFDRTIAVIADEAVRERRAAARGHASVAERAGRQLAQAEKAERADYTVRNDGSLTELRDSLSRLLAKLEAS
jgi:dephospho-CoA kinase